MTAGSQAREMSPAEVGGPQEGQKAPEKRIEEATQRCTWHRGLTDVARPARGSRGPLRERVVTSRVPTFELPVIVSQPSQPAAHKCALSCCPCGGVLASGAG